MVKRILSPLRETGVYKIVQGLSMARDIQSGAWSEPELDLLPYAVRAGESALDIGANYGLYSYHLSRILGDAGKVYAFEPIRFTYSTLKWIVKFFRMRNVEIIPKGCSDERGRVEFKIPLQKGGAMSAGLAYKATRNDDHEGKETQIRWKGTQKVWAEMTRVDDLRSQFSKLTFIKCDTEGSEAFVFRGAAQVIDQFKPTVLCEINPWFLEGFGIRLSELLDFFFQRDYKLYRYRGAEGISRLEEMEPNAIVEDNYLFVHPRYADRFSPLLTPSGVAGSK